MLLLIDNFDSFSHILADYIKQTGKSIRIVRNDVSLDELTQGSFEGIILSPGPETPAKAGNLMDILAYFQDKLPMLGVCLGHQAIGEFFGAKLVKGLSPVHGKVHKVFKKTDHPIFQHIPKEFEVTRYHSLILQNLPSCIETLLTTDQEEIMAIAHRDLPIVGIQYHPEAHLTQYGYQLIKNWVELL
ncbi:aminodeoxychorismate/anthranilate synthase component II [Belliella sp. DSM 111904]|uniref:Aminodeoxychorismate/anthranilate synthase component II n=1 Tax=Belliella filtrata TaxID=2923435 RepID=A0ABS9V523_9BACT|nr:aminodeoxychorismate/anthranilate synthase component II [Belliella filtrata]MCH7411516.1 aminodeoxychorismate/anthranilate synthase component II [Belliella filtrata]